MSAAEWAEALSWAGAVVGSLTALGVAVATVRSRGCPAETEEPDGTVEQQIGEFWSPYARHVVGGDGP